MENRKLNKIFVLIITIIFIITICITYNLRIIYFNVTFKHYRLLKIMKNKLLPKSFFFFKPKIKSEKYLKYLTCMETNKMFQIYLKTNKVMKFNKKYPLLYK